MLGLGVTVAKSKQRQVFVAYSYKTYPKADYRRIFTDLQKAYAVTFIFADEKITNMSILQKIKSYISASDFSIFDVSGWNPNVTLELGFAMATNDDWYVAVNLKKTKIKEVPADLRGLDRMQYESLVELGTKIAAVIDQRYPKRKESSIDDYLAGMRTDLVKKLKTTKGGLMISEIAKLLGIDVRVARLVVDPALGKTIRAGGERKGTRYYPMKRGPIPGTGGRPSRS